MVKITYQVGRYYNVPQRYSNFYNFLMAAHCISLFYYVIPKG